MIDFLIRTWPAITTLAAIIVGLTAYRKQMLEIRELKFKIRELEESEAQRNKRIHEPTAEEIKVYSMHEFELEREKLRFEIENIKGQSRPSYARASVYTLIFLIALLSLLIASYQSKEVQSLRNDLDTQRETLQKIQEENEYLKEEILKLSVSENRNGQKR
jgi:hypothetical protein